MVWHPSGTSPSPSCELISVRVVQSSSVSMRVRHRAPASSGPLVKIGAKVVSHAKYLVFQLEEVAVPRQLFAAIVERIGRLRLVCASG
jgi:hypothetical protein